MDMYIKRGIYLLLTTILFTSYPLPAQSQSLMSVIKSRADLSSFAYALESNDIHLKLEESGPFTVFAPSNSRFDKEIAGKEITSTQVKNMVLNHIITGYASERNMKIMSKAKSLGGMTLQMNSGKNRITVNGVELINLNIKAQNGVLHIINGVIQ